MSSYISLEQENAALKKENEKLKQIIKKIKNAVVTGLQEVSHEETQNFRV